MTLLLLNRKELQEKCQYHLPGIFIPRWAGQNSLGFLNRNAFALFCRKCNMGITNLGLEEATKTQAAKYHPQTDFMPKGCEQGSKIHLLPYIFVSGHTPTHYCVCVLSQICKPRFVWSYWCCCLEVNADGLSFSWGHLTGRNRKCSFVGRDILDAWADICVPWPAQSQRQLGQHTPPVLLPAASATASHWAGHNEKVQIWAHVGWSCQHHWEGAVCK